jgi:hypothetical protein
MLFRRQHWKHGLEIWRQLQSESTRTVTLRVHSLVCPGIALMMEAVSTSETSVNFYQTILRNIPEDSRLHTRRRENLKSHIGIQACSTVCKQTRVTNEGGPYLTATFILSSGDSTWLLIGGWLPSSRRSATPFLKQTEH